MKKLLPNSISDIHWLCNSFIDIDLLKTIIYITVSAALFKLFAGGIHTFSFVFSMEVMKVTCKHKWIEIINRPVILASTYFRNSEKVILVI